MSLKSFLTNSWEYLPIGSLIKHEKNHSKLWGEEVNFGKFIGHIAYAAVGSTAAIVYLMSSLISGTPNPLGWADRFRERQEYNEIHAKATKCVNTKIGFFSGTEQIELPRLKVGTLEVIAERCEAEGGKIK